MKASKSKMGLQPPLVSSRGARAAALPKKCEGRRVKDSITGSTYRAVFADGHVEQSVAKGGCSKRRVLAIADGCVGAAAHEESDPLGDECWREEL